MSTTALRRLRSAPVPHPDAAAAGDWSACAQRGVAVKPKQGDALLFFSMDVRFLL